MAHNDYDRILRENIQEIFVHYVERLLGIEISESKVFHLIELARQKLEDFLCAPNPEEVLLGILSDFGSQKVTDSIQRIIDALQVTSPDEVQLRRYLKQLKILSRIRKLDQVVHEIIERMPLMLDIRDSFDFKEGKAEGKEEGKEEGRVEAYAELVVSGTISIEIAADKLGVGVEEMNRHIANFQKKSGVN